LIPRTIGSTRFIVCWVVNVVELFYERRRTDRVSVVPINSTLVCAMGWPRQKPRGFSLGPNALVSLALFSSAMASLSSLSASQSCLTWTAQGQLRHAAYLGLRDDKASRAVRTGALQPDHWKSSLLQKGSAAFCEDQNACVGGRHIQEAKYRRVR
jgi:hypothetical protein